MKEIMDKNNLTLAEFIDYCAQSETEAQKKTSAKKAADSKADFVLEVMFEGMVRSKKPLDGKEPLGVIFDNHLIALNDCGIWEPWEKACRCCTALELNECCADGGTAEFWEKVINCNALDQIDTLLVKLGGKALRSRCWHWTMSSYACFEAKTFCTPDSSSRGRIGRTNSFFPSDIRPVWDLSKMSC